MTRDFRRILVAVKDPQSISLPAVVKAAQLARAWSADLVLLHCIAKTSSTNFFRSRNVECAHVERKAQAEALSALNGVADRLRMHGIKASFCAANDYPPCEAIVRCAHRAKADLVIAECQAGSDLAPPLLQSAYRELLKKIRLPVLLVKSSRPYRRPIVLAAIDPTHAFCKPTRLDEVVLLESARIQRALRGTLHTVHAYLPKPIPIYKGNGAAAAGDKGIERALRTNIPHSRCHILHQPTVQAIPEVSRQIGAAIVVMGAVSRSGLDPASIGSTAERVLNDLTCDILVVNPLGFKKPLIRASVGVRLISIAASIA